MDLLLCDRQAEEGENIKILRQEMLVKDAIRYLLPEYDGVKSLRK